MRFLSALVFGVLGAGVLFPCFASSARADAPAVSAICEVSAESTLPVAAQPGTREEARDYERREAQSPEVQEFAGGDVTIGVSVGVILLILLIVILLKD